MQLLRAAAGGLLFGLVAAWGFVVPVEREIDRVGQRLESIAAEAAAGVDPAAHTRVVGPLDVTGSDFLSIRTHLRQVQERYEVASPVYTLRVTASGFKTEFVVMTNPDPFVGDLYDLRGAMRPAFGGDRTRTGLYSDDHGRWISAWAPILAPEGHSVAIVAVDESGSELFAARLTAWARTAGVAAAGFALLLLLLYLLDQATGPLAVLRRLVTGSVALRVGAIGGVPVLVVVSVLLALQTQERQQAAFEDVRSRLLQVVSVAAPRVDPSLHAAVVASQDPASPEFAALRDELRDVAAGAQLQSPVYTLRQDRGRTAFVVMTNEEPFVGHTNELRDSVRAVFAGEGAGVEGPYTDAHDTWISAFAPIESPDGARVAAVLQADVEVSALIADLRARATIDALVALAAVLLAFAGALVLGRRFAKPIRAVAEAAAHVEAGDYDVSVPQDRADEVGLLGAAVNRMARGLKEKERLRDMFGKYMAREVVEDLMDTEELQLTGQERDVTVLLSDIRGFTAMSERLDPAELVGLLNEYFAILVDVVIECEGVIDKFMGDALLAWFGAPTPQPDHSRRAILAATMIQERTAAWNATRARAGLEPIATGIGVATGRVVVGNIGSDKRFEYTAIGDAVNLASRLCSKAEAGEVVTTHDVQVASGDDRFHELGALEVKGVREPVPCWRVQLPVVGEGSGAGG